MAAAGTCTIVEETYGAVSLVAWSWTGGTAETSIGAATTTAFYSGKLLFCVTVPDGSNAPADNYDVKVLDKNDVDLLGDSGLNRATGTTESIFETSLGAVAHSRMELNVTNSGSAGTEQGTVYLWLTGGQNA